MWFSLISASIEQDGRVSGYWLQDHCGTLETARARAEAVSAVNSAPGRPYPVAVVDKVNSVVPMLMFHDGLKRRA